MSYGDESITFGIHSASSNFSHYVWINDNYYTLQSLEPSKALKTWDDSANHILKGKIIVRLQPNGWDFVIDEVTDDPSKDLTIAPLYLVNDGLYESGNYWECAAVTEPYCGDGYLDSGEECDDGNNVNGDGCSSACTIESDLISCDTIDRQVNWPGLSTSNQGFVLSYGDESITFGIHSAAANFNHYAQISDTYYTLQSLEPSKALKTWDDSANHILKGKIIVRLQPNGWDFVIDKVTDDPSKQLTIAPLHLVNDGLYESGNYWECTAPKIKVELDIKPGSDRNPINTIEEGAITVAILSTYDFNAQIIDPLTVEFGPAGAVELHDTGHLEDANYDGLDDLVLHFRTQDTGIIAGDVAASITGRTYDGEEIEGTDVLDAF